MSRAHQKVILKHKAGPLQRPAYRLSSSRDAAAVMLFSSAIAAKVITRFKSTCRSFSKRMAVMTIMHDSHEYADHLEPCN